MDYAPAIRLVTECKALVSKKEYLSIEVKGASDFVTNVDFAISDFLKKKLGELYPEISFFSEEETGHLSGDCWILDPIDGTTNLIYGFNLCSVSLAHCKEGEILFGVVYNPFTDEIFTAEKGSGAYYNGVPIRVANRPVGESLIEFGAGSTHKEFADESFRLAKRIFLQCVDIRRICSSALDLCYIASGKTDGYFERVLKPWDIAAGTLILREAGGVITDFSGNSLSFAGETSVVAGSADVHRFLLEEIRKEC